MAGSKERVAWQNPSFKIIDGGASDTPRVKTERVVGATGVQTQAPISNEGIQERIMDGGLPANFSQRSEIDDKPKAERQRFSIRNFFRRRYKNA